MNDSIRISRAPKPPTPIKAQAWNPPKPEPSECPADLPSGYPGELKLETLDAINRAIKAHPTKDKAAELCKDILQGLTPTFSEVVRAKRIRADLALDWMSELLRCILIYNVGSDSEHYRLGQELRTSDEWSLFIGRLKKESMSASQGVHGLSTVVSDKASLVAKYKEIVVQLESRIEEKTLSLQRFKSPALPAYRGTIQQKVLLQTERDRLKAMIAKLEAEPDEDMHAGPTSSRGFIHSPDYRSVNVAGKVHSLTPRQAHVIQILHKALVDGTPEVGKEYILEEIGTPASRLKDSFKSNLSAWKALVRLGKKRGLYRLNF
jgi:hypothetical protein